MRNRPYSVVVSAVFAMMSVTLVSCAGEDKPAEPVQVEDGLGGAEVPSMPGPDAGEAAAEKGMAEAPVDAPAPMPEMQKSGPNVEGAVNAGNGSSSTGEQKVVSAQKLNVRGGPGVKFKVKRTLSKGTPVNIEGCQGTWCKIGPSEYVSKKYLK